MPVTNQDARIVNVGPVWSGMGMPELHVAAFVHKGMSVGTGLPTAPWRPP